MSSPSPTTSGSTPPSWRSASAQERELPLRVIVGEEVTTRNGHLVGLFMTQRIKPWGTMRDAVARIHDQGGICIVAHPLVPYPLCASEGTIRRMLDEADPARHPDAIEAFNPTTARMRWSRRVPAFVDEVGLAAVASSDAHHADSIGRATTLFRGTSEDDLRAAILARDDHVAGQRLRLAGAGGHVPAADRQERPRGPGHAPPPGAPSGHRPRPGLPAMKIGLVTPYIYPLPGGVNAHVDELYQNLVVRGHDVRIISSTHGPQKSSEGDIIRLGYGWSVPTNGSVGTLTVSHRYGQLVQEMLDREQFDLLHFHEPFVPFLSLQLLRFSTSVNVATFHAYSGQSLSYEFGKRMLQRFAKKLHGRIAVSAAARHFIERYFPGDYKVIPNGVDLRDFRSVAPFARWRDGTLNILYIGRFENRKGAMYLLKAYRQLRREGLDCRLLMIGAGPQEREIRRYIATRRLVRASSCWAASATRTRCGRWPPRTCSCRRPPGRSRSASCSWRRWPRARPSSAPTSTATRAWSGGASRRCWCRPRRSAPLAAAIGTVLRDPVLRARMGAAGRERAVQFGWPNITAKVDDYYGFVIRRLAAQGALPPGFRARVPEAPPRPPAQLSSGL